jgi:hypothetical protein
MMALAILPVPFGLDTCVQVRKDVLIVHPFFALHARHYPFSDVTGIVTAPKFVAPNGRIRHERDFVVHFTGGGRWIAGDLPSQSRRSREIIEMISKKSGVPIRRIPIFQTSDLYPF